MQDKTPHNAPPRTASQPGPEPWACHLLGLIAPLTVLSGNITGGVATLAGTVLVLLVYPLLDLLLGRPAPARPPRAASLALQWLLYAHVLLHSAVIATLCWRALHDGNVWTTWAAMLSTGINTGASGIIVAHELGHRKPGSIAAWLSRWNLLTALYLHFAIEHNRHHHPAVATDDDPTSAPRGRGLWLHFVKTLPAQFVSAWSIAKRNGQHSLSNPVLLGMVVQVILVLALWQTLSATVAFAFVGQAGISIFLLEYVNYIRHYGLYRAVGSPATAQHSWQSEARWSRWTLLDLTRHPAHHLQPGLRFWQLQPYPDVPSLPAGYYALFWPALVPPLWRRLMDHRLPQRTLS
ncbi:MAG: alkane 1-monooxygenase [Arenicellales bacterium]|jgi:alkane 1-monooxygenase|nr:alkane 1-monooxygenase [Arenicellales bacterium]|tara:strand:- start:132 stop:1181 length:1050 start_codon:yes stop_codon:yes gene_type:complete